MQRMQRTWPVLIAACFMSAATPASARQLPYCIKGCDFGGSNGDCSFSTLAQCQATASGRDASCAENPYFNVKADMPTDPSRQSRRRF
jgi:hypothetical protein